MTVPAESRRLDIRVLRAVAVLLVLGFHAGQQWVPLGFLGVDVFFVISGFLMTRIIMRGLESGTFSFREFYLRRARRLVPAALSTLIVTSALAAAILTHTQWREFLWQVLGASTFSANFVLYDQGGYFDRALEKRPLLHFWSLAVEEQFYLLFPLVLWLLPARLRLLGVLLGFAASAALFALLHVYGHYAAAFYMLPPRLWQLLAGALAAWAMARRPSMRIPGAVKLIALSAIVLTCLGIVAMGVTPRSFLIVVASAVLLLGQDDCLTENPLTGVFGAIGDWSYSLYLIHWPLLAFAISLYAGAPPPFVVLALIMLAFPLAWLQYRLVEQPFRTLGSLERRFAGAATAATALLAGILLVAPQTRALATPAITVPPPVRGLASDCSPSANGTTPCRTSDLPRVAVWGDSFAMHLMPGLLAQLPPDIGVAQFTIAACTPVLAIGRPGEQRCIQFSDRTISAILASPDISVVVMSSTWELIGRDKPREILGRDGMVRAEPHAAVLGRIAATVKRLQAAGKHVVLVGPTPMESHGQLDPPLCNIRDMEGRPRLDRRSCDVAMDAWRDYYPAVRAALERVAATTGAPLFMPEDVLCDSSRCATRAGRTLLYRDENHLSEQGSVLVVERMRLGLAIENAVNDSR